MARTKPVKSVVEVLRLKLGLHQDEFADRVGISRRTLQNIEYGALLSWKSARAISLQFNISEDWLMANDPDAPMVTESGKPWTLKTQGNIQRLVKEVGPTFQESLVLLLSERAFPPLLEDYLKFRPFFMLASMADQSAIARWREIRDKEWTKFLKSYPELAAQSQEPASSYTLSRSNLESIKEDVEAVLLLPALRGREAARQAGSKK